MANTTKVQPGLEAETAVIGALIYAPEIVKDVLFAVREQDFGIEINRKMLAEMAVNDAAAFTQLTEIAKKA